MSTYPPQTRASYDRGQPLLKRSLAYYQFKSDFTAVNDHYWGTSSSLRAVGAAARHIPPQANFRAKLGLNQKMYAQPLGHTVLEYRAKLEVAKRWHNLLTIVLLASALERYIDDVCQIAMASDPALTPGFPKKLDGLTLLKHGLTTGDRPREHLVRGEWSGRRAAFDRLFGSVPLNMQKHEGTLERMRKARNRTAHNFGLDDSHMSPQTALLVGARRPTAAAKENVSDTQIKKYFAAVDETTTAIDEFLLRDFIGGYEIGALCIEWNRDKAKLARDAGINIIARGSDAKQLSKFAGTLLNFQVQYEYFQDAPNYVSNL